ncbi:DNA-binding protein [Paraburkholderia phytofirmans]|uniref:DNA-binding protein n=1 Tax=Paraburkholderia phytofirmans TaxID=261302 RepID=UPI0009ECF88E|nr:DNA-binding protein [Paraburkholderia phytofirmans]
MEDLELDLRVRELMSRLMADPRSANEIARLAGVSQPTVSRFRLVKGRRIRGSASFNKLCSFYGVHGESLGRRATAYNELLRDAIVDAWDGSEEHGQALLVVIEGLKGLKGKPDMNRGGARGRSQAD